MVHNLDVVDSDGGFVARPDGWIDSVALAWEIDSFAHHASPADYEYTLQRRQRMQNLGIVVVAHTPKQLTGNPKRVIADLRIAYQQALARPRPSVSLADEPSRMSHSSASTG